MCFEVHKVWYEGGNRKTIFHLDDPYDGHHAQKVSQRVKLATSPAYYYGVEIYMDEGSIYWVRVDYVEN